jgi:signal transduction histidine kinase
VHVVLPESAVRQVLFNLLVNAIEATPRGNEVTVIVETKDAAVVISIIDQGPGIPPEIQPRIFEPFFTTKEGSLGRGLGLGLSISKDLVETMNGRLQFHSHSPDPGAMFIMTLPRNLHTGTENHD